MSSNIFKITAVAATIAASFGANAALYNVYLEAPEGATTSMLTYGVAISPDATVCWTNSCNESSYTIATEVKSYREGFSYRDEAPFFLPFGWVYLEDDYDGFESYCRRFLGYTTSICEIWAGQNYTNGYKKEQDGVYTGSIAYLDSTKLYTENAIVNSIDNGLQTGNKLDGNNGGKPRAEAFTSLDGSTVTDLSLTDVGGSPTTFKESHAWKTLEDGGVYYTVGSVSTTHNHETEVNNSYAAVWIDGVLQEPIAWLGSANDGDSRAHASARDIIKDGATLYAVGYNSDVDERFKAAVFKSSDNGVSWTTNFVDYGSFPYDSEDYANQELRAVNDNKIAIGTAKLNQALNGAYANTLFYVDNLDSPSYKAMSGDIFFSGANGLAGNINNHNDVVGTIDYEQLREINGSPRAQRAFIANLGTTAGSAPIGGKARYLDDLTYGSGATTDNNQFRIIQAADINDAGVIAATAYYCAGGYDTEAIDSGCAANASLVGVKLVPINGQTASDISSRPVTQETVERQGGTLGIFVLTLLGLIGFRRK